MLWAWVARTSAELREDGHEALARAVARLPRAAAEGDVALIRRELPDLLTAAADVPERPWLENYLRHWPITARVEVLMEGATALDAARDRLRAAHAEGGSDCPPAACAAENVLACLAVIDGPGHVRERAALLAASVPRTSPGDPAFESLALAHADMLIDDDRPDEAVRHLDDTAARVRAAGKDVGLYYGFGYVRALRTLDRYGDALRALDHLQHNGVDKWPGGVPRADAHRRIRFERARILAWLVRAGRRPSSEAVEALPDVGEAEAYPYLRPAWAEAVEHLAEQGAVRNDWRLGVTLTSWVRHLERVGAHRPCLEMSLTAARLATARGARWVAESALRRAEDALGRVHRAEDLDADFAEARANAAAIPAAVLPVPAAELIATLAAEPPEQADPERQADLVLTALPQYSPGTSGSDLPGTSGSGPEDTELHDALARFGRALQLTDAGAGPQWERVRRDPGDQSAALALLETLLYDDDRAGVRTLVRTLAGAATPRRPSVQTGT